MSYSSSYSSSTNSGTSTGVTVGTSSGDESSSSSITVDITTQTSSPDDSDGLAAVVGGSATALGEDTLATGSISGSLVDGGTVTSADLSATMVAASEDGETANAWADTFAGVSDGAEVVFGYTVQTDSSQQGATGSTATSTSSTTVTAYDIDLSDIADSDSGGHVGGDEAPTTNDQPDSSSPPTQVEGDGGLDGNIASIEFDALAVGDDTVVEVDAFALAIEGELSISEGYEVLAVD